MELRITNKTSDKTFKDFAIKFNNNSFKMQPTTLEINMPPVGPQSQ